MDCRPIAHISFLAPLMSQLQLLHTVRVKISTIPSFYRVINQIKDEKHFSVILTSVLYPISTHWCWSGSGWLSEGGFYDFAGSGVVHVSGGIHALIGILSSLQSYCLMKEYKYLESFKVNNVFRYFSLRCYRAWS